MSSTVSEGSTNDVEYEEESNYDSEESGSPSHHLNFRQGWHSLLDMDAQAHTSADAVTFADLACAWGDATGEIERSLTNDEKKLILPRLEADALMRHGTMRADLDSVKALVPMKDVADIFHPDPLARTSMNFLPRHLEVMVHLVTAFPKSAEHLRGTGFAKAASRGHSTSVVSIPKIPKPRERMADVFHSMDDWPYPSCDVAERQEWISLADVPHFLMGTCVGSRTIEVNLWCVCLGSVGLGVRVRDIKLITQKIFHKVKELALNAIARLLGRCTDGSGRPIADPIEVAVLGGLERLVYEVGLKWRVYGDSVFAHFGSLHDVLYRWNIFEVVPTQCSGAPKFEANLCVLDTVTKLFVVVVQENLLSLSARESTMFRHCMVYLEAKGMKERVNACTLPGTLHPNMGLIRATLHDFVPSLALVSRGLCRVDIGWEWQLRSAGGQQALMWSMGNHLRLLAAMPPRWRKWTRMYNSLGLAQAVDLQTHVQFWIPPPPWETYGDGMVPLPSIPSIPNASGPYYMDVRIPNVELDFYLQRYGNVDWNLFEGVSVLNIYCPGPRKLASSFGRQWALDFEGVGPLTTLLASLGEADGIREDVGIEVGKILTLAHGFVRHVEKELPAQRAWSVRAEVGARSVDEAVRLLSAFANSNAMSQDDVFGEVNRMHRLASPLRVMSVPLHVLTVYITGCIHVWLSKLKESCSRYPMSQKMALTSSCAEQALKNLSFLFRGQSPWSNSVAKILLHEGILRHGVLLPSTLRNVFNGLEDRTVQALLKELNRSYTNRSFSSFRKDRLESMMRMLESSVLVRSIVEEVQRTSATGLEEKLQQLTATVLHTFYSDLWSYLVRKGHWGRDSPRPSILCDGLDCIFDVDAMQTRLAHADYNSKVGVLSVVHPTSGPGRRSMAAWDFLDRWFPVLSRTRRTSKTAAMEKDSRWFFSTRVTWDVICTSLNEEKLRSLLAVMAKTLVDVRLLHGHSHLVSQLIRASGALVPDGRGPNRPFNTLNRWQVIVGGITTPFVAPPAVLPRSTDGSIPVTRKALKEEHSLFSSGARRGFTDHELNVFSMFMLLEGCEDRLNDIANAPTIRCTMNHLGAFLDLEKATLYCFRIRRTVTEITEKFNAACRANPSRRPGWSLREALDRIRGCLGGEAIGQDGRLNKLAAHSWLLRSKGKTLEEYRSGFEGRMGPRLTENNTDAWNAHVGMQWTHAIPDDLKPLGGGTSRPPSIGQRHCEGQPMASNRQMSLDEVVDYHRRRRSRLTNDEVVSTQSPSMPRDEEADILFDRLATAFEEDADASESSRRVGPNGTNPSSSYYGHESAFQ